MVELCIFKEILVIGLWIFMMEKKFIKRKEFKYY
jgi:hypothetical protein